MQTKLSHQQSMMNMVLKERYQIETLIGEGGLGTSYQAIDLQTQRPVAVKVLQLVQMKEWKNLEMFELEAKILRQLKHSQIPAYIDYFLLETASNTQFVLVQEYIEGDTLQHIIDNGGKISEEVSLKLVRQLANILEYLHTLRPPVIHRDITPRNIILGRDKKVYLVDFGAVQEKIRTTFFERSSVVGTCGYTPFEQFNGSAVPVSDYYALGGVLLFVLTHKHPSEFPLKNLKPVLPQTLRLSPKIVQLLDGLLEPDARKRIASPHEIATICESLVAPKEKQPRPLCKEHQIPKPPQTDIIKESKSVGHILFRIPMTAGREKQKDLASRDLLQMFKKKKTDEKELVLELTPQWINFNNIWNVPTDSLRPTGITWFIMNDLPVLGINTQEGETVSVDVNLTENEIRWLISELHQYLSTLPRRESALPEIEDEPVPVRQGFLATLFPPIHLQLTRERRDHALRFTIPIESELTGCLTMALALPIMAMTMALPPKIFGPKLGGALIPFLWLFVVGPLVLRFHFLINTRRTILEVTPEQISFKRRILKWEREIYPSIPLSALQETDVNWFGHLVNANKGKRLKLSFGFNYQGKTYSIEDLKLNAHAVEKLVQDVRDFVARHDRKIEGEEAYDNE